MTTWALTIKCAIAKKYNNIGIKSTNKLVITSSARTILYTHELPNKGNNKGSYMYHFT